MLHFDCVEAIIEVKTKIDTKRKLNEIISKLTKNVEEIRSSQHREKKCWAGLFIYEDSTLTDSDILESLQANSSNLDSTLNCVVIGKIHL